MDNVEAGNEVPSDHMPQEDPSKQEAENQEEPLKYTSNVAVVENGADQGAEPAPSGQAEEQQHQELKTEQQPQTEDPAEAIEIKPEKIGQPEQADAAPEAQNMDAGGYQQRQDSMNNKLETEAEQEIAAALFDLANNAAPPSPVDHRPRVPKGHNINDTILSSRKRPRKPNRNYLEFEDPGDDDDDEDWDAEDEYLHQRMNQRGRGSSRAPARGSKNPRNDRNGGYGHPGMPYGAPPGYNPGYPGYPPHGNMHQYPQHPYAPQPHHHVPAPAPPMATARFKRGANHIAIAHFIQWHKASAGPQGYGAPTAPPQMPPQPHHLAGPDVMSALNNLLRPPYPGAPAGVPPALLAAAAARPGPRPGMPGMQHPMMQQDQRGPNPNDPNQSKNWSQMKQLNDILKQAMQRPGGPPQMAPRPAAPAQPPAPRPAGAPMPADATQALKALQSALPYLTNAASGQAPTSGGAETLRSLQQTLQSAISKLPQGAALAAAAAAAGNQQPAAGGAPNNLAGTLAALLRQQQMRAGQQPGQPAAPVAAPPAAPAPADGATADKDAAASALSPKPAGEEGAEAKAGCQPSSPREKVEAEKAPEGAKPAAPTAPGPSLTSAPPPNLLAAVAALRNQLSQGEGGALPPGLLNMDSVQQLLAKFSANPPAAGAPAAQNGAAAPTPPAAAKPEAPSS